LNKKIVVEKLIKELVVLDDGFEKEKCDNMNQNA
tara:strand:+ start:133 stop:234 length:102 start_codon:yes stop_codon:yes gene_type:complete